MCWPFGASVKLLRDLGINRRDFIAWLAAASLPISVFSKEQQTMYGLIGRMVAQPGKREELAQVLLDGIAGMPGCLSYIVALADDQADALWITEVWESREMHQASLDLASVQAAIAAGRPMIAGFGERFESRPLGGQGLA